MSSQEKIQDHLLSPYRILDLTEGGYMIGGKILGDLGADVIKIESPGGSPSRKTWPFYKDIPDPEKSLSWFAYNVNKRGVTLDITKADGQALFKELVKTADIVMESFSPGYLDSIGLGYNNLSEIKPEIVLTSITPFGQSGPYAHYEGPDIVLMAMGGSMYTYGVEDRAPLRIGYPQAESHGGAEGASASMIALWHRLMTGEGQHVDVSAQLCIIQTLMSASAMPKLHGQTQKRQGDHAQLGFATLRYIYPAKEGHVFLIPVGGYVGGTSMRSLVNWMDEEGMAPDWMKEKDWEGSDIVQLLSTPGFEKELAAQEEALTRFFATHTAEDAYEEAVNRGILLASCGTAEQLVRNPQLIYRGYYAEVEHPELNDTISYPAIWGKLSETPIEITRRAPLIGEHNQAIYEKELGLSKSQLLVLQQTGSI